MLDLTFGEQVKIILRRKGMTIKELAEIMEARTGKKMSRQNLTQRLGRDNFQEQDMRQIAEILGCRFQLSIMEESVSADKNFNEEEQNNEIDNVNDLGAEVTVGEVIDTFGVEENIAVEQVYEGEMPEEVYVEPACEEAAEEATEEVVEEAPAEELAISAEEVVEEAPAEELAISVEEAVYEEPVYEESAYEEPVYEESAYEEPVYEEAVYEEPVYEEPVYEEPVYEQQAEASVEEALKEMADLEQEDKSYKSEREQKAKKKGWRDRLGFNRKAEPVKSVPTEVPVQEEYVQEEAVVEEPVYEESAYEEAVYEEPVQEEVVYEEPVGDINPYTGLEYETNSVRMHPKKIGYVQVYDREGHDWIDMTEWAFMGYQEQKKMLLGKDYDPPIYID